MHISYVSQVNFLKLVCKQEVTYKAVINSQNYFVNKFHDRHGISAPTSQGWDGGEHSSA